MPEHGVSTPREKLACIARELAIRYRVYPKAVKLGKMTQRQADMQIRVMEDIAADYTAMVQTVERLNEPRSNEVYRR